MTRVQVSGQVFLANSCSTVKAYLLVEDVFEDVPPQLGGGRQKDGVDRRHDGGGQGTDADHRHVERTKVLEDDGQNVPRLAPFEGRGRAIAGLVPV